MKPTYQVRAWRESGWWQARIVAASGRADLTVLNALTHARTMLTIEQVVRDLVTTILEVDDTAFDIEIEYVLPKDLDTLVCEAIGAATWLDAARDLWLEHTTVAVGALTAQGFTLTETATLLGMSDQEVDQLLESG